ncbi:MAG: hypothetical protein RIC95_03135 [Vicingaceae bacterium]
MAAEKNNFHNPETNKESSRIPKKIDFRNEQSLIYQNDLLKLTVLGGIKLEGLDRMRSTLKIELKNSSVPPVRHNLDLYNDNQTEKLIRKTAEKLEVGLNLVAGSIAELTAELEEYRMKQIKENQPKPYEPPKLSAEERKEAEAFLKSPNLLERTNELIGKSGVVGEETNRLIMFLIFTSRKRNQPLHIVSLGSSGTGKTHLQEKVGELIPEEDRIEITTLSENAFYYFGQRELKNKLILIEDLDGAENVLYPLRELQSKKRISKTVAHKNTKGETRTLHLVVEGPVSVAGCTTKEQIYEDNANRSFLIYLDESEEQDRRIMEYQRRSSAGKLNTEEERIAAELLCNCQRLLEPVKVVNPFAEYLQIPREVFKPRRTNNHYLQFIEAVTFYYQHQRKSKVDTQTGEIYIETTIDDIAAANKLLKSILLRKSDDLSGACRNHFERLKQHLKKEEKENERQPGSGFTNREISKLFRTSLPTIKRYHLALTNCGYLRAEKQKGSKAYQYQVVSYEEYQALQEQITSILDDSLKELEKHRPELRVNPIKAEKRCSEPVEELKSSKRLNEESELIKAKKESELNAIAQEKPKKDKQAKEIYAEESRSKVRLFGAAKFTYQKIKEANKKMGKQNFTTKEVAELTGRNRNNENQYLRDLHKAGLLKRFSEDRHYVFQLP